MHARRGYDNAPQEYNGGEGKRPPRVKRDIGQKTDIGSSEYAYVRLRTYNTRADDVKTRVYNSRAVKLYLNNPYIYEHDMIYLIILSLWRRALIVMIIIFTIIYRRRHSGRYRY